jgi:nicotinamidase-related amidase
MQYTISKIASMAGISTKTLRYYEKLGLLIPSARSTSGYRLYSDEDIVKLQRILLFKQFDFPLRQIESIVNDQNCSLETAIKLRLSVLENSANKYTQLAKMAEEILKNSKQETTTYEPERPEASSKEALAILVFNMQNDFVTDKLGCERLLNIVPNLQKLLVTVRKKKSKNRIKIIYVCDSHIKEIDNELSIWGDHAIVGTEGAEIIETLKPQQGDLVIYKRRYSAFFQTKLQDILHKLNIGTLIFTGAHLHISILHSMEDAFCWGYRAILIKDCAESFTEEDYNVAIRQIKQEYDPQVITSKELCDLYLT